MTGRFSTNKFYTRRAKYLKYYNLILMILFSAVIALVLFFAKKGGKRSTSTRKIDINGSLMETINIRLHGTEDKSY